MSEITDYRKWVIEQMLILGRGDRELFRGCSQQEIELLMEVQSVDRLPQVYYELLTLAGKSWLIKTVFLCDLSRFEHLFDLKKKAIRILSESDYTLPSDAFVFFNHQGEHIMYFLTDNDSDDPPVFEYYDDEGITNIGRFSDLVSQWIEESRGY